MYVTIIERTSPVMTETKDNNFDSLLVNMVYFPEFDPDSKSHFFELVGTHSSVADRLKKAIGHGDAEAAAKVSDFVEEYRNLAPISDDLLQSAKYHAISYSAICMEWAVEGGVRREILFAYHFSVTKLIDMLPTVEKAKMIMDILPVSYSKIVNIFGLPGNYSNLVRQSICFITSNITKKITLRSMCDELNVSKSSLTKLFRTETGYTVNEYIDRIKITVARILLCHTLVPLTDISSFLSFASINHFSHYFKKKTGMTASEFRKNSTDELIKLGAF